MQFSGGDHRSRLADPGLARTVLAPHTVDDVAHASSRVPLVRGGSLNRVTVVEGLRVVEHLAKVVGGRLRLG